MTNIEQALEAHPRPWGFDDGRFVDANGIAPAVTSLSVDTLIVAAVNAYEPENPCEACGGAQVIGPFPYAYRNCPTCNGTGHQPDARDIGALLKTVVHLFKILHQGLCIHDKNYRDSPLYEAVHGALDSVEETTVGKQLDPWDSHIKEIQAGYDKSISQTRQALKDIEKRDKVIRELTEATQATLVYAVTDRIMPAANAAFVRAEIAKAKGVTDGI